MDFILLTQAIFALVLLLIYILVAVKSRGLPPLKLIALNIGVILVLLIIGFLGVKGIPTGFKKAKLVGPVKQSRSLSTEQLTYYGSIKNTGSYTINHAYVTVKVVDNVSGAKKSSLRGEGDIGGSLESKCIATKRLRKGETRRFSCSIHYPPSYQLAGIKFKLSWD